MRPSRGVVPQISPRSLGLLLPVEGAVRQGEGRRVKLAGADGKTIVAQVHLDVADQRVVVMPDGQLKAMAADQTKPTQDEFVPATRQEAAAAITAKELPEFKTKITAHYAFVYNCSEEFFTGTSSILESMYPGVQLFLKRLGLEVHEPVTPLVVIMFKTRAEFDALHPMPPEVAAYYDAVSNHVVLYEETDLVDRAPELALRQAISTIAHEGVHQILHNNGVQKRLSKWPLWIGEGLPEYLAPTSIDANNIRRTLRWKGAGTVNDLRMFELDRLLKDDGANADELIARVVGASELDSTGYAASWALTHFLALKHKAAFARYLKAMSRIEPLADRTAPVVGKIQADPVDLFNETVGKDWKKLSRELLTHLRKLPYKDPLVHQTFYVVVMAVKQGPSTTYTAVVTTSPGSVREWRERATRELPEPLRGAATFSVRTFPNRNLAEEYLNQYRRQ